MGLPYSFYEKFLHSLKFFLLSLQVSTPVLSRESDWKDGVLKADFHQGSTDVFDQSIGSQCSGMSTAYIAHAATIPVLQWGKKELNRIQHIGDNVYEAQLLPKSTDQQRDFVFMDEVDATVECLNGSLVHCYAGEKNAVGVFDKVPGREKSVQDAIAEYLKWETTAALITVHDHIIGLWKEGNAIYAFDSQPRNYDVASVTKLEADVNAILKYLEYYCPEGDYKPRLNNWYQVDIRAMEYVILELPTSQHQSQDAVAGPSGTQNHSTYYYEIDFDNSIASLCSSDEVRINIFIRILVKHFNGCTTRKHSRKGFLVLSLHL